mgnify:CR=1 FL=1
MTKALQTMEWMTPGSNLNAYIQGAAAIPILSIDEEKSLGESLFYNEDLDAARKLVNHGVVEPSGYTEPRLHSSRLGRKGD